MDCPCYRGQLQASSTVTEPSTGQPLTKEQMSQLATDLARREEIKDFFTRFAASLKVDFFSFARFVSSE
jgi:hypothetical protein